MADDCLEDSARSVQPSARGPVGIGEFEIAWAEGRVANRGRRQISELREVVLCAEKKNTGEQSPKSFKTRRDTKRAGRAWTLHGIASRGAERFLACIFVRNNIELRSYDFGWAELSRSG